MNINRSVKQIKGLLEKHKNQGIKNLLENLSSFAVTDYSLQKVMSNIKRPQKMDQPIRTSNGDWFLNDGQKAIAFADYPRNFF